MKKFAYYLPQFHEIPENNAWWGQGFTEWTNVKKAKPLFAGHKQPKKPLDGNYYDLSNENVLIQQAELAKDYGLDGMIFYHYYFCGKKLLEKPAEMLLANKDIPMNFFFCWANHSWYRSWEGSKELLMEQKYGGENNWEEHFQYLLPFFKDDRYEKRNQKPLFLLFDKNFAEKNQMMDYFNKRCRENGFKGICVIESIDGYNKISSAIRNKSTATELLYSREPWSCQETYRKSPNHICYRVLDKLLSMLDYKKKRHIRKYNGNALFNIMIHNVNKMYVPGLFFEWDNTPRHGRRGYIISAPSKETFEKYMNCIRDSEYVFINAWNEWCEGMMLEPTEENGYKYLQWLKEWSE